MELSGHLVETVLLQEDRSSRQEGLGRLLAGHRTRRVVLKGLQEREVAAEEDLREPTVRALRGILLVV